jgi:hypothetical protein
LGSAFRLAYNTLHLGAGEHPFLTVLSSKTSPNGRYVAREEDFGDDSDAFSGRFVYTAFDAKAGDCPCILDPCSYRWIDSHTLAVEFDKAEDAKYCPPAWRGVRFVCSAA